MNGLNRKERKEKRRALPLSPGLKVALDQVNMASRSDMIRHRVLLIAFLSVGLGVAGAYVSQLLMYLINLLTAFFFYGDTSLVSWPHHDAPSMISLYEGVKDGHLGWRLALIPVFGGLLAGLMARFGSRAIQGHGIPEAVEGILANESKISPKVGWLKPVSAAFVMGSGGPFGPEGPIIATGGALGSLIGQLIRVTADERKVLLAAGAAAGMAATFGAPVASLILATEVLLFELRARSLIPVTIAVVTAVAVRYATLGNQPVFDMPPLAEESEWALVGYALIGALVGYASVWVTRFCYLAEDGFAVVFKRIHWMWWPVIGALIAGLIGYYDPRTLGVGYDQIDALLNQTMEGPFESVAFAVLAFGTLKFLSWAISLGSGTSGGTLAPLFMIGGSFATVLAYALNATLPFFEVHVGMAALVGMGALFSGSAHALLTAVVFSYEATQAPGSILPLMAGCGTAYLVSSFAMRTTIMSEKLERRGLRVPSGYVSDYLTRFTVGEVCSRDLKLLKAGDSLESVRAWLRSSDPHTRHQGFPVVSENGELLGLVTQRFLLSHEYGGKTEVRALLSRAPVVVYESHSLRDAADHLVRSQVGRLLVLADKAPHALVGILTRGDILRANVKRIHEGYDRKRAIDLSHAVIRPVTRGFKRPPLMPLRKTSLKPSGKGEGQKREK